MSANEILVQIRQLPPQEQREIFERLRDDFDDEKLSAEQIAELDRRAEEALKHPERCRPLDQVVADMERRFRAGR